MLHMSYKITELEKKILRICIPFLKCYDFSNHVKQRKKTSRNQSLYKIESSTTEYRGFIQYRRIILTEEQKIFPTKE